jgi:hypothetical protein
MTSQGTKNKWYEEINNKLCGSLKAIKNPKIKMPPKNRMLKLSLSNSEFAFFLIIRNKAKLTVTKIALYANMFVVS